MSADLAIPEFLRGAATPLVRYEAACRAVAEAKSVDEVQNIRGHAEAMRAYARQAKNKQLEVDALEIRVRAERRLGLLMETQKKIVGLSAGGRPSQKTGSKTDPVSAPPTLAEAGIDKHLADRARKFAAVPNDQFEARLSEGRERVMAETGRVRADLLRMGAEATEARGDHAEPDNEDDVEPENYRTAFLIRVDTALEMAAGLSRLAISAPYSKAVAKDLVAKARQVADAWMNLSQQMEKRL